MPSSRSSRIVRRAAASVAVLAAVALVFLDYIGMLDGNVREVVPHRVFRSAQLDTKELGSLIEREHIRTVVSLRNGWWDQRPEIGVCDQRGVTRVDIPFSANSLPPPEALKRLIDTFDHASYPLLFHCQGGADRSGLVGALYLALYEHTPLDSAEHQQLTWRYGHFPVGATKAMDDFFDLNRRTGNGRDLRQWILNDYPHIYAGDAPNPATGSLDGTPAVGAVAAAQVR